MLLSRGIRSFLAPSSCVRRPALRSLVVTPGLLKDKALFTPGPLTTSPAVKEAMLRDLGSRDIEFIRVVKSIRQRLLNVANLSDKYTSIIVQGAGTFAIESTVTNAVPRNGKLLVVANGAYGHRIADCGRIIPDIEVEVLAYPEVERPNLEEVEARIQKGGFDVLAMVHCETSSGMLNPVEEVGALMKKHNSKATYFVDAMSSYGGVPLDVEGTGIDWIVSSANKCIQGVPGFSYVICKKEALMACEGNSRSLSFDLVSQFKGLEESGQFRFTPATHAMLAFNQALNEFEAEGGTEARAARYQANRALLRDSLSAMGFKELLSRENSGYIITSYHLPKHPNFSFEEFYNRLNDRDLVIYPGKVTEAPCFRIGNIGDLHEEDMRNLIHGVEEVCAEMGIELPIKE